MADKGYAQVLADGFSRAIPWAIVFVVAWAFSIQILLHMLRPEVKKAIDYGVKTVVSQSINTLLTDPNFDKQLWPKIKQNTKEAIEYTVTMASHTPIVSSECKRCMKR